MASGKAQASIIVDIPPEKFFKVISDFESYPEFVSEVKRVKILERTENALKAEFEVFLIKTVKYTLNLNLKPPKELSWTLSEKGFFKQNDGSWELKPVEKGKKTDATYTVELSFGMLVPKPIVTMLTSQQLPQMLKRFKERAEMLFKK